MIQRWETLPRLLKANFLAPALLQYFTIIRPSPGGVIKHLILPYFHVCLCSGLFNTLSAVGHNLGHIFCKSQNWQTSGSLKRSWLNTPLSLFVYFRVTPHGCSRWCRKRSQRVMPQKSSSQKSCTGRAYTQLHNTSVDFSCLQGN